MFSQWWFLSSLPSRFVSPDWTQLLTLRHSKRRLIFFLSFSPNLILGKSAVSTMQDDYPFLELSFFVSRTLRIFFFNFDEQCFGWTFCFTYFEGFGVDSAEMFWERFVFYTTDFWGFIDFCCWLFWVVLSWLREVKFLSFLSYGWEVERVRGSDDGGSLLWSYCKRALALYLVSKREKSVATAILSTLIKERNTV